MLTGTDIQFAVECLRKGELVVMPTETVYGLAANAFDSLAVAKIFEVKKRPFFDPLILHIHDLKQLDELFEAPLQDNYIKLINKFWPGPLTLVSSKTSNVPAIVSSGLSTVAVRMPSHPMARKLLQELDFPLAAPSANLFGCLSPTIPAHINLEGISYILDGGKSLVGIESTILMVDGNEPQILRPGGISLEEIQEFFPAAKIMQKTLDPLAPGQLESHYSPLKPFIILNASTQVHKEGAGLIQFSATSSMFDFHFDKRLMLSKNGDMLEAASNLFELLHQFESDPDISFIYMEPITENGIGVAIMDRAKKAAFRWIE